MSSLNEAAVARCGPVKAALSTCRERSLRVEVEAGNVEERLVRLHALVVAVQPLEEVGQDAVRQLVRGLRDAGANHGDTAGGDGQAAAHSAK